MKTKFYLAMAAAALFMSNCSQEEALNQVQGGTNTLTATIEGASRSAVTDAGVFSWTSGDAISVYNGEDFTTFTWSSGNAFTSSETITPSGVAIYPAGSHTYDGTTTKVNLATAYNYGSTNAPMVAAVTNTTLAFKHVGGLMRFIVKGMPSTATSFTFTANTGITGDFEVSNDVITAATASESNKTVTINFTTEQYDAESMTFYIPLPTGTYEGYTVSIGDGQGMSNVSAATVKNTISRGTLLLMPTFTYDETNGLNKGTDGGVVTLEGGEQALSVSGTQAVEVDASGLGEAEAVLNLNYTPEENSTLTLSESGDETESQEESAATVSISVPNNSTVNELDITMPSMTVELNAEEGETATYTTVNALTAQNTLKIGKGVSVGTLNIKGGHIRLGGSITTEIKREGEGTDIIYIILEEGVTAPTVDFPDNVKVVTAAEWDLKKAIAEGGNYTLTSDVATSELLKVEKDLILDLGGHTLAFTPQTGYPGIKNTANLEVKNGTITSTQVGVQNNGTLTINCNIESVENAINNVYDGETTINGGTYKNTSTEKALINSNNYGNGTPVLTINGGTFESVFTNVSYNNSSTGAVNAGTFKCTGGWHNIYVGGETGGCNVTYDAEKCSFESNGINIQVNNWGVETNKNTLNNTEYTGVHNIQFVSTFDELKSAITAGSSVVLTANISDVSELLKVEKDLSLDLGGHTLAFTPQTGYPGIKNTANLEVKNGTITSTQVGVQNNGTLTINCNIESLENAINNVYDGETTINGGTYKNTSTEKALINSNNYGDGTPVLTINGGTFESVFTNVSYNNSSTGAVNAGTFKCTGEWHNIYVGGETGSCNVTYKAEGCSFESNGINIIVSDWGTGNTNAVNNTNYTTTTTLLDLENE